MLTTDFLRLPDDNGILYILFILSVLKYSDPDASMDVHNVDKELKVIITPSNPDFKDEIIDNIVAAHRMMKLKAEFSKSTIISKGIYYSIIF